MIPQVPPILAKESAQNNLILFIGSGISMSSGLPNWGNLLSIMMNHIDIQPLNDIDKKEIDSLMKESKYLLVAEEIKERMSKKSFKTFFKKTFLNKELESNSTHYAITEIPLSAIITTNYDSLIEDAYNRKTKPDLLNHYDVDSLSDVVSNKSFYLLKIHGDASRVNTIVLSRSDYREMLFKKNIQHALRTVFSQNTVLFIGYSINDLDIRLIIESLRYDFENYTPKHYALMNGEKIGNIEASRWEKDYGIKILKYKASKGHPEIELFLKNLIVKVAEIKIESTLRQVWNGIVKSNYLIETDSKITSETFKFALQSKLVNQSSSKNLFIPCFIDMQRVNDKTLFKILFSNLEKIISKHINNNSPIKDSRRKPYSNNLLNYLLTIIPEIRNFVNREIPEIKKIIFVVVFFNAEKLDELSYESKGKLRFLFYDQNNHFNKASSAFNSVYISNKIVDKTWPPHDKESDLFLTLRDFKILNHTIPSEPK